MKLVQRFYVPEQGELFVDGVDIAMIDPAWLRRQIGVVLQENMLFNRSVPRTSPSPTRPCRSRALSRWRSSGRRRIHSGNVARLRHGRWKSAALICPVASANASRLRVRSRDRSAHSRIRRGDIRARLRERTYHPEQYACDVPRARGDDRGASALPPCAARIALSSWTVAGSSKPGRTRVGAVLGTESMQVSCARPDRSRRLPVWKPQHDIKLARPPF